MWMLCNMNDVVAQKICALQHTDNTLIIWLVVFLKNGSKNFYEIAHGVGGS